MGIRDSAHDMPMGPFRTQQVLLAFGDNILEGHTAKEADIGGEEGHPDLDPSG